DIRRAELRPDEHTSRRRPVALGAIDADVGALRIADDRHPADLGHVERAGCERATCPLRVLDGRVDVRDLDVVEPVRRRRTLHRLAVPAVCRTAGRDHGVVVPERLRSPAEKLRVELLRLLRVGRNLLVPNERADRLSDGTHVLPLLSSVTETETSVRLRNQRRVPERYSSQEAQMTSIQPELWVDSPREALVFYQAAFGATVVHCVGDGDDIVAQLGVGDAAFWIAPPSTELKRWSPRSIDGATGRTLLVVDDPDTFVRRAVAAGAIESSPVGDEHGWRLGRIVDPFGHEWEIGRQLDRK